MKVKDPIQLQLFAGIELQSTHKEVFRRNTTWHLGPEAALSQGLQLEKIHHDGKEYLGVALPDGKTSLTQLNELQKEIKEKLHSLFPDVEFDEIPLVLISQMLIQ